MALTPEQRRLRAQIAANTRWSRENPTANAIRAQAGLLAKFEREVDPDGTLPPAERARRVESAKRAHFQRLALRSAQSRRRKAAESSSPDRVEIGVCSACDRPLYRIVGDTKAPPIDYSGQPHVCHTGDAWRVLRLPK